MRRHKLPSPLLFRPHVGRLKLTAVRFIVFLPAPRREYRHDGSVPVEVHLYLIVIGLGVRLEGLSGRFLTGESLCLVRYFAIRESKDKIVTPKTVEDGGILSDKRSR